MKKVNQKSNEKQQINPKFKNLIIPKIQMKAIKGGDDSIIVEEHVD